MNSTKSAFPVTFWIIAIVAVLWNLIGIGSFISDMMISPEKLATLTAAQQDLYENNPMWLKAVYGIATIGGLSASILLLLRKSIATPIFLVSLIAIIIQFGYTLFGMNAIETIGTSAAVFPIILIAIGGFLWYYSKSSTAKGWLS